MIKIQDAKKPTQILAVVVPDRYSNPYKMQHLAALHYICILFTASIQFYLYRIGTVSAFFVHLSSEVDRRLRWPQWQAYNTEH